MQFLVIITLCQTMMT